jgi:cell division protein ZapA (FtsZ GTPase activity inhibitor)
MPYIFIAILVAGFASGYGVSHQISKAEIQHITDSITAMNREAEIQLATLTEEVDKAHEEALKLNKELEDANVSAIKAINSQHDSFKSVRMYDNSRKSSSCTATKGDNTSSTAGAPEDRHELSDELTSFLKSEAYRADQIAAYAALCQKFVVDNNCGIRR